ncbi:MAG: fibronectin type III domain-containing protein [Mobilitalea sp.]
MKTIVTKDKDENCKQCKWFIKPLLVLSLTVGFLLSTTATTSAEAKDIAKVEDFSFTTTEKTPSTIDPGIDFPYGKVSEINEFWGVNNQYYIAYSGKNTVYISILNEQMKLQKTLEIKKDLPLVGNVIQDQAGNFYIIYGKYDTANMETDASAGSAVVITVVQYSNTGKELKKLSYTGIETSKLNNKGSGTKEPFNYGNCDVIIDSKGILVCRYGRVMYNTHQSSHALYIDTNTMTKLKYLPPYTSHSIGQKVIATSDGSYLMVDRGDAFDRGFQVHKVNQYTKDMWSIPSFIPFHFRNGYIYQTTYSVLGGLAECSNGYALSGVSEKTLSYVTATDPNYNESRNLFLQVFSKNFTSNSSNQAYVQLLSGETRKAEGTYVKFDGACEAGAVDYGVLWLTNYTGNYYASNPKMISIGNDQLLFMWEKKLYSSDNYDHYISSCYMVVSSTGEIIIPETEIQDKYLTTFGEPTYRDGYVYWTTSDGKSKKLVVHRLAVGKTIKGTTKVESISTNKTELTITAGQKIKLDIKFYPANADNKKLGFKEYEGNISISEDGYITVLNQGLTEVEVWAKDRPSVKVILKITTTDNAPKNLKATTGYTDYYDAYAVKLTWKKTALNQEYDIYRSTKKSSGYVLIDSVEECEYFDTSIKEGKTYYYKVKSTDSVWFEDETNPMSNTTSIYVLPQIKYVKAKKLSNTSVQISWTKLSGATGYEIFLFDDMKEDYKLIKTITSNSTLTYNKTGLKKGYTYYFSIRAYQIINGVKCYNEPKECKIRL